MATSYKVTVECSCGCGKQVEHEFKAWGSGACRVRAHRDKAGENEVVDLELSRGAEGSDTSRPCSYRPDPMDIQPRGVIIKVNDKGSKPKAKRLEDVKVDPMQQAVDFIKSRGYAGVCRHGSAIGLCRHGCK